MFSSIMEPLFSGDSGASPEEIDEVQLDDDVGELPVSLPGRLMPLGGFALIACIFCFR